jgi:hypothetical protein
MPQIILILLVFLVPAIVALLTADLDKVVTWGIAVIGTPFATIDFLFHRHDGEFYAEGHLFMLALGWWSWLWAALPARAVFQRNRRSNKTPKPIPQPRDSSS